MTANVAEQQTSSRDSYVSIALQRLKQLEIRLADVVNVCESKIAVVLSPDNSGEPEKMLAPNREVECSLSVVLHDINNRISNSIDRLDGILSRVELPVVIPETIEAPMPAKALKYASPTR